MHIYVIVCVWACVCVSRHVYVRHKLVCVQIYHSRPLYATTHFSLLQPHGGYYK